MENSVSNGSKTEVEANVLGASSSNAYDIHAMRPYSPSNDVFDTASANACAPFSSCHFAIDASSLFVPGGLIPFAISAIVSGLSHGRVSISNVKIVLIFSSYLRATT